MKALIFLILFSSLALAKPVVLVSYFDPFQGTSSNNSENVAKAVAENLNLGSALSIELCALNTIFDKAYAQLENCLKKLPDRPAMVLSLGEGTCELKMETMLRNNDRTIAGPDNAGVSRNNTRIIPEAPAVLGLRYPSAAMFCALDKKERRQMEVSNDAGSFVCNNTGFQMSHYYGELQYGFIHVPNHKCDSLSKVTQKAVDMLGKMIPAALHHLQNEQEINGLPHPSNDLRLLTTKNELKELRNQSKNQPGCVRDYLTRSRGHDERRSFFGLGN